MAFLFTPMFAYRFFFFSMGCIIYTAITGIFLIHYKDEKNITELQIEERQIIRILQLIGTDFF